MIESLKQRRSWWVVVRSILVFKIDPGKEILCTELTSELMVVPSQITNKLTSDKKRTTAIAQSSKPQVNKIQSR